jgi:peptidoglycan/xylan/chitin deacetylase (PgdA/CDA1 family)
MGQRFGHDFSRVRVHTDAAAERSAQEVNALAYAVDHNIVFGSGQFTPGTNQGRRLIAHELAHVVQNSQQLQPSLEHVVRRAPPDAKESDKQKESKWEKDYYYDTEKIAKDRVEQLKETWTNARYYEIKVTDKTQWQVEKLGPEKKPAKKEVSQDQPNPEAEKSKDWTPDTQKFEQLKDAEVRKKQLKDEDEWEKYQVKNFKEGKKDFYQVEMRGKLKLGTTEFALTFDDGPHTAPLGVGTNLTEKVLDTLAAEGIKGEGAFFVQTHAPFRGSTAVGKNLIKRMSDEGYTVGIHTGGKKDHEAHPVAHKEGRLESELEGAKSHLKEITGSDPELVRAPFGQTNADVHKVYTKLKLKHLHWDIDGDPGGSHSFDKLKSFFDSGLAALKRGSKGTFHPKTGISSRIVVLYHDIRKGTANNIGAVIKHIKTRVPKAKFKKP